MPPTPSCCATPGLVTAMPPAPQGGVTRHPVGGRLRRTGPSRRHQPLVRRVRQRARRMPGIDRPGFGLTTGRQAIRLALPRHHDPRHGARPGPARRPPRHRCLAHGDRWIDGWHASPRMGRDVPGQGPWTRADRRLHAVDGPADRLGGIGRRVIALDPRWRGGDYYDAAPGEGPGEGLAIARMVAQVTFRSDNVFTERFGRSIADRADVGDHLGCGSSSRSSGISITMGRSSATALTPTATS